MPLPKKGSKIAEEEGDDDDVGNDDSQSSNEENVLCFEGISYCPHSSAISLHNDNREYQSDMPPSDAPDDVPAQINDVQGFGEDEDEYLTEQIIEQANIHVVKAQVQRNFARNRAREAEEDTLKPHEERSRCIIMDYAQNLGLPPQAC